jgi:broad specificity phosphatase PhoE
LREFEFDTCTLSEAMSRPDLVIWDSTHRGTVTGETLANFSRRVTRFLDEVTALHLGEDVVLVTHSGVIDAAIRWCIGVPAESPWMHDFPLSNASITEVEFWPHGRVDGGAPRYSAFLRVADCSHILDCASDM